MGILELFGFRTNPFLVRILVKWPEGTEYLSNGPFFDKEEG